MSLHMTHAPEFGPVTPLTQSAIEQSVQMAALQLASQPLPNIELAVKKSSTSPKLHHFPGGSIEDRTYTMNDGTRYRAQHFAPAIPTSEVLVVYTTPWCTDLEGYNTELGKALAVEGLPALAIGPEDSGPVRASLRLAKTALVNTHTMAHDAEAYNAILDEVDDEKRYAPGTITMAGYSRGGMVGAGTIAYASRHGRDVAFASFRDLCVLQGINFAEVDLRDTLSYLTKEEPVELIEAIGDYTDHEKRQLLRTAPLKLGFWVTQITTGFDIFRGNTSAFIDNLPVDTAAHLDMYSRSRFNHHQHITTRSENHPNMIVDVWDGTHMSGIRKRANERTVAFLSSAHDIIYSGSRPNVAALTAQVNETLPFRP